MKIKARYNPQSIISVYLFTLISVILSYFLIPFDNPRPFELFNFILWVIAGNIFGLILALILSLLSKRQFLLIDSTSLIYHGYTSPQKIEISQLKSIKFEFEHKGIVEIDSENVKIHFLAKSFLFSELNQLLLNVINVNQSIVLDEYTKAIISQDTDSWLVREDPIMKLVRFLRLLFGYLILVWIIIYVLNEVYLIFIS